MKEVSLKGNIWLIISELLACQTQDYGERLVYLYIAIARLRSYSKTRVAMPN